MKFLLNEDVGYFEQRLLVAAVLVILGFVFAVAHGEFPPLAGVLDALQSAGR